MGHGFVGSLRSAAKIDDLSEIENERGFLVGKRKEKGERATKGMRGGGKGDM